jgi:hypothetical protein
VGNVSCQCVRQCSLAWDFVTVKGVRKSPSGLLQRKRVLSSIAIMSIGRGLVGEVFGKSHLCGRLGRPASTCQKDFLVRYVSRRGKLWASLADTGFKRREVFKILMAKQSLAFLQYVSRGRTSALENRMFVWVEVKQFVTHRRTRVQMQLSLLRAAVFGSKTSAP